MKSIELFSGCGGLGLGLSRAGFEPVRLVEIDGHACRTLRGWRDSMFARHKGWSVYDGDVHDVDFRRYEGIVDLVAGGPPCQPFSVGGKHKGHEDRRNLFPEMFRAIREIRPKAVIIENVQGLGRAKFAEYFAYIQSQIRFIGCAPKDGDDWQEHYQRLIGHEAAHGEQEYMVFPLFLNAADYGVPQQRKRIKFVCFRSDLKIDWPSVRETHSEQALLHSQWVTGEYWDLHKVAKKERPELSTREKAAIAKLKERGPGDKLPWLTVRDALAGLPDPRRTDGGFANHNFVDGARQYPGHTGSPLEKPSKALKAGDHGVPGGENMIDYRNGSVRYFTVREAARIQTFPDWFEFHGPWTEAMRQLGNAVPVKLAQHVAGLVKSCLEAPEEAARTPQRRPILVRSFPTTFGGDHGKRKRAFGKGRKKRPERPGRPGRADRFRGLRSRCGRP